MNELLETVELAAGPDKQPVTASIIWLHGLGADGHDFEPIVPELRLPPGQKIRFVFPHAPVRPVTLNNGIVMRAWYDIVALDRRAREDEAGIRQSAAQVSALIARESARGIPASRVVLAGFSQGGAIALQVALRHPDRLAGLIALSCYLPLAHTLEKEAAAANGDLPVFFGHGSQDPVLPEMLGREAHDVLQKMGYPVRFHSYPMQHAVCPQEIDDIGAFLAQILPEATTE